MKKPFIEAKDLSFSYDDKSVFESINFSLKENGFYLFLGPNGGGKTTLIRLLMGLCTPKKGNIFIGDRNSASNQSLFGYIPQKLHFDPKFPICLEEFVMQGLLSELTLFGRWRKETKNKCSAILAKFNLTDLKDKAIGDLSGGQLQRASIARALICDPKVLILDEPLSGLDAKSSSEVLTLIESMRGKKTIILITHVMTAFLKKADNVFLVEHGIEELKDDALCKHLELGLFHTDRKGCSHE